MTIDDELARLFQAERTVQPPPQAFGAGWSRLALDLAASAPALPVAAGPLKLALSVVPKWLLGGFALGLFGAGTVATLVAPNAPPITVAHAARAVTLGHARATAQPLHDDTAAAPALANVPAAPTFDSAAVSSMSARARALAAPSAAAQNSTFDAELALISLAKAELDAGRPSAARAVLSRHAELFPAGAFATERDALTMVAECQAGPKNARQGERFAALHPGSPLVQRVERACALTPPKARFLNLPNGGAALGEPMAEPNGETQR